MNNTHTDGQAPSTSPTKPKIKSFYRLERRENGKLSVIFDGLTLSECFERQNAGMFIRLSYTAEGGAL